MPEATPSQSTPAAESEPIMAEPTLGQSRRHLPSAEGSRHFPSAVRPTPTADSPADSPPSVAPRFFAAIEQLQGLCQTADHDSSTRMQQVDRIQDELIKQLDDLDACLQIEIARLTAARTAAHLQSNPQSVDSSRGAAAELASEAA